jgi:HTH-type transcriptional regulator / antitoxin HigA
METEDRMIRATRNRRPAAATTYRELMAAFPLRPLHDEVDYDNALEAARQLVGLVDLTEDQADYLDLLTDVIQKYETQHHAIRARVKPLETLRQMLKEKGMNASDLGRLLGHRPLGSAILRGERQLSKANILALARFFKVSTDLFIGVG